LAVNVDSQLPRTHVDPILVDDDDRLTVGHIQTAPGAVENDRTGCLGFGPVQHQALVCRDPQLAGYAIIALPQHAASLVQT
jgi:hypothetical protein